MLQPRRLTLTVALAGALVVLVVAPLAAPLVAQSADVAVDGGRSWARGAGGGLLFYNSAIPGDSRSGLVIDGWLARRLSPWSAVRLNGLGGGFPVFGRGDDISIPCSPGRACSDFNGPDYIVGASVDLQVGWMHVGGPYAAVGGGGYATQVLERDVGVGGWHAALGWQARRPGRLRLEVRYLELIRGGQRAGWVVPVTAGLAF